MKKPVIFLSLFFFLIISVSLSLCSRYLFAQTGKNLVEVSQTLITAIRHPTLSAEFNFLFLGLDRRDDWLEKSLTTDTIIVGRFADNKVKLVSLPRDLWDYQLKTKINGIYPLSLEKSASFPFVKENFTRLTGLNFDRILVIDTQNLVEIIDLLGGVDVFLDQGFTDHQYPNPDYISTPKPSTPIYITVEYPSGWNHLDGRNISPFIRSRKSAEVAASGGTDLGRIRRQQLVLEALVAKIKSPVFLSEPSNLFSFYRLWRRLQTDFTDTDIASIVFSLRSPESFSLEKIDLPVGNTAKDGLVYHPEYLVDRQWVFLPADEKYTSLHNFFRLNF